jgi:hypothetical protein
VAVARNRHRCSEAVTSYIEILTINCVGAVRQWWMTASCVVSSRHQLHLLVSGCCRAAGLAGCSRLSLAEDWPSAFSNSTHTQKKAARVRRVHIKYMKKCVSCCLWRPVVVLGRPFAPSLTLLTNYYCKSCEHIAYIILWVLRGRVENST